MIVYYLTYFTRYMYYYYYKTNCVTEMTGHYMYLLEVGRVAALDESINSGPAFS